MVVFVKMFIIFLYILEGKTCQEVTKQKRENDVSFNAEKNHHINPHQCNVCQKNFSSKKCLYRHTKTHTGEKKHVCITCGRAFTRKDVLQKHIVTHIDEKPHICSICPPDKQKCFKTKHDLHKHMKIHGEKNIHATCVNINVMSSGTLKRHIQSHINS